MKNKTRPFSEDCLIHCYQKTKNGFLLFYSISDYLVFFTLLCVTAPKYGIIIHALCLMMDHIHAGVQAPSLDALSGFWRELFSLFTKANNSVCHHKGSLFNSRYGSALKTNIKSARTNIIYIGNNPVERHLVEVAEDYQWNFLAYGKSDHPFSKRLVIRRSSSKMKKAINEIRDEYNRGMPLSYQHLQRLFKTLSHDEKLQLVDYIVVKYSVIDFKLAANLFGSIENAINAMHYNTGNEYDIPERFTGKTDKHYLSITTFLLQKYMINDIHEIFALSEKQRESLFEEIARKKNIPRAQIAKYLRIVIKKPK